MRRTPSIAIVTPSLNQAGTIEETIRSVREQEYSELEHYVIDGGSKDGTVEILERQPHLLWVSEPDHGPVDAINKGLHRARGDVLGILTAEDRYLPGAFEAVAEAFQDPECFVLVGECEVLNAEAGRSQVQLAQLDAREDLLRWWKRGDGVCVPQPAVFLRRAALDAVGPMDAGFRSGAFLELCMRLAKIFPFSVVRRPLAVYRETPRRRKDEASAETILEYDRAARMHLDLAAPEEREKLMEELDRHAAERLLAIAEESGNRGVLKKALGYSRGVAVSGRFWRTLLAAKR